MWLREQWLRMTRVKPRYLPPALGRKRAGKGADCAAAVGTLCYGLSLGVALTLTRGDDAPATPCTAALALVVAGFSSTLAGLCTAEYLSSTRSASVYAGCYQGTGEFLAFVFGWVALASHAALAAALCRTLALHLRLAARHALPQLEATHAEDALAAALVLAAGLLLLPGVTQRPLWFAAAMPGAAFALATVGAVGALRLQGGTAVKETRWGDLEDLRVVFSTSAVFVLFFNGTHSATRLSRAQIGAKAAATLGGLHLLCLVAAAAFVLLCAPTFATLHQGAAETAETAGVRAVAMAALSLVALEAFQPLHGTLHEMAGDGLLCRGLAKPWQPFCFAVAPPAAHTAALAAAGLLAACAPFAQLLAAALLHPLLVNSAVPLLVLWQRYRDNSAWQYEPMFQASSQTLPKHRSRSEFQFVKNPGYDVTETKCVASEDSSDTDVDSVVQEYQEQTRVANLASLTDSGMEEAPEPSPGSAVRAKLCVCVLLASDVALAAVLNLADLGDPGAVVMATLALGLVLVGIAFAVLTFLPQNADGALHRSCAKRLAKTPLVPVLASLATWCLLVHCLVQVWQAALCWIATGTAVYFAYGARHSTAATSFHDLATGLVALQPAPSHMYRCAAPQVIRSHRRPDARQR